MIELGFKDFDVSTWYSFMVPRGTPPAIVSRLHDETVKAVSRPDVQQLMAPQGLEAETSTPEALAARIRAESKVWADVIRSAGIKPE